MDKIARERQQQYRQRRKELGLHRLDVWVPPDVLNVLADAIDQAVDEAIRRTLWIYWRGITA